MAVCLREKIVCDEISIEIVYVSIALKGYDESTKNVLSYAAINNCKSIHNPLDGSIIASKGLAGDCNSFYMLRQNPWS